MELMTKELEERFNDFPICSQEGLYGNAIVIAKYFNPIGSGTWLIIEASKDVNGDWLMFGYVHLGDDNLAEFGYVALSELQKIKLPYGFGIERDIYLKKDITLLEAMEETGMTIPDWFDRNENMSNENIEEYETDGKCR